MRVAGLTRNPLASVYFCPNFGVEPLSPPDTRWTFLLHRAAWNFQLTNPICQSRSFHPEPRCRSVRSSNDPVRISNCLENMFAFHLFESTDLRTRTRNACSSQLVERWPERVPRRQDHCPLDKVLQFAHVAWPRIARKDLHRAGRNCFNAPVHSLGILVDIVPHKHRDVFASIPQGGDE